MSTQPKRIGSRSLTKDHLQRVCDVLGVDPTKVDHIAITPDGVTVTEQAEVDDRRFLVTRVIHLPVIR